MIKANIDALMAYVGKCHIFFQYLIFDVFKVAGGINSKL